MKEPVSSLAGAPSATVAHSMGAYASADYGVEDDRVVFTDESGAVLRLKVLPSVDATLSEVRSSLRRDPSTAGLRGGAVRIDSGDALLDAVSMRRLVVLLRMEYGISVAGLRCTPAALQRFAEQVLQTRVRFAGGALEMALFEGPPPNLDGIEPLILAALPPPPAPVVELPAAPVALVEDDVQAVIPAPVTEAIAPGDAPPAAALPLAAPAVPARASLPVDPVALSQPDAAPAVEAPVVEAPAVAAPIAEAAPAAPAAPAASLPSPQIPVQAAVGSQAPVAVSPAPTGRGRRRRKGAEPAAAVAAVSPPAVEAPVAMVSAAPPAPIDEAAAAPAVSVSLVESSAAEAALAVEARAVASPVEAAPAPALAADESSADLPTGPAAGSVVAGASEAPVADAPPVVAASAAPAPLGPTGLALAVTSSPPVVEADDPRRPGEVQPVWTREGDRRVLAISRTLRSGAIIRFAGDVVVYGDVNAGAHIEAGGNIVVLGSLRGLAHAGAQGDEEAIVLGFDLKPAQLRIADHIAFPLDSAAPRAGGLLSLFSRDRLAKGGFSPVVALLREGRIVLEDYRGRLPG
jgi:septum site-determining protein MinC